ncbi:MAG: LPS assembly protein LptD [Mariprofundus sp.]|nr:LPS assembly protein LptD [Mariprofundus sp.]
MLRPHRFFYVSIFLALFTITSTVFAEPVDITADEISRTTDGIVNARGHVVIKRQTDTLTADEVIYRTNQHVLEAKGHVIIKSEQAIINAEQAIMHTGSKTGNMRKAVIILPGGERLAAERVKRIDDHTFEAEELTFSSCPIDQESWRIAAKHAVLDQQDGSLTAKDSRFELWGVPVLYTPWWQQSTKRKSGFLIPGVNIGKRRGTEIALPYYFAPSENWDTTLTPHWMSARGFMGEAELRHASSFGHEEINFAGINDTVTSSNRGRIQGDIHWNLPANMALDVKADHISDNNYLADYATGRNISTSYLQSIATLSQSGQLGGMTGDWFIQAQHQQTTLLPSNAATLQILPRLQSNMQWELPANSLLHIDQQTTRFDRREASRSNNFVDGWRFDIHPYIEIPWELKAGGISATLTAGSHHTRYWLQKNVQKRPKRKIGTKPIDTTPFRSTAEISLEMRSDFESINEKRTRRNVISPIVRYDYIYAPDQTDLPNFDSRFSKLTLSNLLSGNRFTGYDRIEHVNRFSLMLESKLQFKDDETSSARDAVIVSLGTSYDLLQQRVDTRLQRDPVRAFSNVIGEIILEPVSGITLRSSGQYNTSRHYWATMTSSLGLSAENNQLYVGYTFTDKRYARAAKLIDLRGAFSLNQRWQATGGWKYDVLLKSTQQASVGLQYTHACWKIGLEGYRINRRSGTSTTSNVGFHLLLEFKGLGSVGS